MLSEKPKVEKKHVVDELKTENGASPGLSDHKAWGLMVPKKTQLVKRGPGISRVKD